MTDKMTVNPLKQIAISVFSTKVALVTLLSTSVLAQPANAVELEWWFDVEVILFERNLDTANITEKFKQSQLEQPSNNYLDLLTPYLHPDLSYLRAGLTYCRASNQLAVKNQYDEDFAFPVPEVEATLDEAEFAESADGSELAANEEVLKSADGLGVLDNAEQSEREKAIEQSLPLTTESIPERKLELAVGDSNIFLTSDPQVQLTRTIEPDEMTPSYPVTINGINIDPLDVVALDQDLPRPPIQVEFIEWQVPSVFPCAYAEQIDPSFASISSLQKTATGNLSKDYIKRVPEIIKGTEWQQKRSSILLSTSTMFMSDLYEKIKKQRDISPILHLNWRQQVKFGRENGQTFRLFAGKNYADQFDTNGLPLIEDTDSLFASLNQPTDEFYIPEQELALLTPEQQQALFIQSHGSGTEDVADDLFAKIDSALADDTAINFEQDEEQTGLQKANTALAKINEIWQIDGGINVYLRNVGRVPYLHIDSNLDFRQPIFDPKKAPNKAELPNDLLEQGAIVVNQMQQPNSVQPNFLQSVNFNQLRRVISKQVHYFDHPLFGMVVSINRYRWPEEANEEIESETPDN